MALPYNASIFNVPENLISRGFDDSYKLPEYRTEFMRDRDRVMYSTAFRRLAGKTQIYTVGSDDHKKNRLTHTLEVSQIARTIAIGLGLNEHLAEAIALAHDFGHTPFGHAGEEILNKIMSPDSGYIKDSPYYEKNLEKIKIPFKVACKEKIDYLEEAFGFKHNLQSVRVCVSLEDSYRDDKNNNIGLNLTNYTLYGIMVHSKLHYCKGDLYPNFQNAFKNLFLQKGKEYFAWSFEAYIVALSDEIAQWHHDLEDAIRGGALPLNNICDTIERGLGEKLSEDDKKKLQEIKIIAKPDRKCISNLSHIVVNTLINATIENSKKNFTELQKQCDSQSITDNNQFFEVYSSSEYESTVSSIISASTEINSKEFEGLIKGSVHHSRNVERMNEKGKYILRKLFEAYYAHPQQLPDGPILHILVDTQYEEDGKIIYNNIDEAVQNGIGAARVHFNNLIESSNAYQQCIIMRRICDHIASMTDHYAIEEYNNLYG